MLLLLPFYLLMLCFCVMYFVLVSYGLSFSIGTRVLLFFRLLAIEWELIVWGGGGGGQKNENTGFFFLPVIANWHGFFPITAS